MVALFVIWFVISIVAMFWAASVAHKRGYPYFLWLVLGFFFGVFALAASYLLPPKERDEQVLDAAARSITTGVISAGEVARDTFRDRSPGLAKGVGRGLTNAALNVGTGAKEAVGARRESDENRVGLPPKSLAKGLGNRLTRAAMELKAGVDEARGAPAGEEDTPTAPPAPRA